jgi:hypothetical protein
VGDPGRHVTKKSADTEVSTLEFSLDCPASQTGVPDPVPAHSEVAVCCFPWRITGLQ